MTCGEGFLPFLPLAIYAGNCKIKSRKEIARPRTD
jgi:hypothetical protein